MPPPHHAKGGRKVRNKSKNDVSRFLINPPSRGFCCRVAGSKGGPSSSRSMCWTNCYRYSSVFSHFSLLLSTGAPSSRDSTTLLQWAMSLATRCSLTCRIAYVGAPQTMYGLHGSLFGRASQGGTELSHNTRVSFTILLDDYVFSLNGDLPCLANTPTSNILLDSPQTS